MAKANSPKKTKADVVKKSSHGKHTLGGGNKPSGAVMTIINKAAAMKLRLGQGILERKQLSTLTKIKGKSTIANALTKIKDKEWMIVTASTVEITDEGMQVADHNAVEQAMLDIPTNNAQYLETVKDQHKLKGKAVDLIDYIQDGKTYKKNDVAAAIGCKMNSTFANLLTSLKKLGLVEYDSKTIRLVDTMFPFEPRAD